MNQWYLNIFKNKYAQFSGRASRKEFWMFFLFHMIILTLLIILMAILMPMGGEMAGEGLGLSMAGMIMGGLIGLFVLGTFVPSLAISIRRLHDTNRSGWWYLLCLIPIVNYVGSIVLLVFYCLESTPGDNRFGPSPKGQIDNAV